MDAAEATGVYTYRSLLNQPDPVGDFNAVRFAEAEVNLLVRTDGTVGGTLAFPPAPGAPEQSFLDLSGQVLGWEPLRLRFTGTGRADTDVFDFVYDYEGEVAPTMPSGVGQRLAVVGSVVRSKDHGTGAQLAKAGATASFVAVKRPFVEPRDVPGVGLIEPVLTVLAGRHHRLHHMVWHTLRNAWWTTLEQEDRDAVTALNWGIARPPLTQQGGLDLTNGAGEDFLFMHRRMIAMVRGVYVEAGVPAPVGWATLPAADTAQFAYTARPGPVDPARRVFAYDPAASGFSVPPATEEYLSIFSANQRAANAFLKSPQFFATVMRPHERIFRSPRYLASLSLGALGNLLEFTIHNQMHMRWASVPRDPVTGTVGGRGDFDLDAKWDDPRNDWLGDFYSSHVNPVFWRLHGWVDDRIEDWFRAHEAAQPGGVRRRVHKGVDWFDRGEWVGSGTPFDQPDWWDHEGHSHHHGAHGNSEQKQIDEMLAVIEIVRRAAERPAAVERTDERLTGPAVTAPDLTSFAHWLDISPESSD